MPCTRVIGSVKRGNSTHLNIVLVATHCLFEAVVALVTRTRGLKVILLKDGGDEGTRVCSKEKEQDKRQCNAGQRQSCMM